MEEVPPEMILNWDQSGIKLVPSSNWTLEKQGSKRVELTGMNDKRQITYRCVLWFYGWRLPTSAIDLSREN